MSKWPMQGQFRHLHFKTFPMTPRTPQCEVFWPFNSSSKLLGVPEDSKFPLLGVWASPSHLAQSGVATITLESCSYSMRHNAIPISISCVTGGPTLHHSQFCSWFLNTRSKTQLAGFSHIGWSELLPTSYKVRETSLVSFEHSRKTKRCLAHLCFLPKNTRLSWRWTKHGVSSYFNHLGWTKPRRKRKGYGVLN
jgi:hypothetical protein